MKIPRVSISTLMAVVSVVAVYFATGGPVYGFTGMEWQSLLTLGALPMACILAIGFVLLKMERSNRPDRRRFLTGFVACGVAALFLYIACAWWFIQSIYKGVGELLNQILSPASPFYGWSLMTPFLVPQLFAALLGGWIHERYRITIRIERRPPETAEPSRTLIARPNAGA
jgi:hypothetical protein